MQKKPVFYTFPIALSGLAAALLAAALLFASCANAVNSRGGPVDGSGSSSGSGTIRNGSSGGGTVNSAGNGLSNGGSAPDIVIGSNAASYEVDRSQSVDFAQQTGTTVDTSGESGLGYVTVTPLPAGTLFTETQSGLAVSWTTYSVTVTINGTDFPVSFTPNDTRAVVIEKVPVGATLSAGATIGVTGPDGAALGYSSLTAATASPVSIQSGANSITMWVQYPLTCTVASASAGNASVTGTAPSYYSNAGPTALPAATPSYEDNSTTPAKTMRFTGWALTDGGTPVISGNSIPAGIYKGKLTLYATYSECALSITGSALPASGEPLLEEGESLALTAVPEGFPAGAAVSYSWTVEAATPGAAVPVTVSGSGTSATVTPVAGASGSATVRVTATCGTLTATAAQNVTVLGLLLSFNSTALPADGLVVKHSNTIKKVSASVPGYSGTPNYSWTVVSGSIGLNDADTDEVMLVTSGGGTNILRVTATISDGGFTKTLSKDFAVHVLEVQISGASLSTDSSSPTLMAEGGSAVNLTASLVGISDLEGAEFTWVASPAPSDPDKPFLKLTPGGAGNASCSLEPKQADDAVNTLTAKITYRGVEVKAERYIKVVGLRLTGGSDVLLLDHSSSATNTLSFTLVPVGGFNFSSNFDNPTWNINDDSIATFEPSSGGVTPLSLPFKLTAAKAGTAFTYNTGVVTVTVSGTVGADAIPVSVSKEIIVMDLVVKRGTYVVPDNGNTIAEGSTVALTARLNGPPAGSTIGYTWESTPPGPIDLTVTSGGSTVVLTTGTGLAAGTGSSITVTATYKGTEYSRVIDWSVGFSGSVADFLSATFAPNTSATPCTVKIMGAVSAAQLQQIATALGDSSDSSYKGSYINLDLSAATGLTSTGDGTFYATGSNAGLATYLTGITLPSSGLTTIGHNAFRGCTNLSGTVTVPASCNCIGKNSFKNTGITALSDGASPARTWHRIRNTVGSPDYESSWSGMLSGAGTLNALNTEISDDVLYIPYP